MWRRVWVRALAMLLATVVLAACRVDTTVELVVNTDGTGTVTVTVVADADVVDAVPDLADDLRFDDLAATGWTVEAPALTPEGGLRVVLRHPFTNLAEANAVLAEVSGATGPLTGATVTATGGDGDIEWAYTGRLDLSRGLDAFGDQDLAAAIGGTPWADAVADKGLNPSDVASLTLRVSLPGTRVGDAGEASGPAGPQWSVKPGDPAIDTTWRTRATSQEVLDARDVQGRFVTLLIGYGAFVVLLVALWFWLRARRRPTARPTAR